MFYRQLLPRVFAVLVAMLTWAAPVYGVSSYAIVQEDGSLRISGNTYRLYGVYIPTTGQTCRNFERPPNCGTYAALALDFKIGVSFVNCEPRKHNDDGTITAYCTVNDEDLSVYLLERGWALALPDAPFEYHALEKIARNRGVGVWGLPVVPRHAH
jgi:endonuclease YncB( thermonuclease family)